MNVRFKYWIYQHYLLILFGILIITFTLIVLFWKYVNTFEVLISIFGGVFSFIYFVQKQQLDELNSFRELFADFNSRYDKLNEKLNQIIEEDGKKTLNKTEFDSILNDYFNLCGEEYLYYKNGYIYPEVWKAWCNGMDYFLRNKTIGDRWAEEEKTDSYYGLARTKIKNGALGT